MSYIEDTTPTCFGPSQRAALCPSAWPEPPPTGPSGRLPVQAMLGEWAGEAAGGTTTSDRLRVVVARRSQRIFARL